MAVTQVWHNQDVQFFYCNWLAAGPLVYGSVGKEFGAMRWADGEVLWERKDQADANCVAVGDATYILRGDGRLGRYTLTADGLADAGTPFPLLPGRTWAPPLVAGGRLYARDGTEVVALSLAALPGG